MSETLSHASVKEEGVAAAMVAWGCISGQEVEVGDPVDQQSSAF
jgi:hypothetical protein